MPPWSEDSSSGRASGKVHGTRLQLIPPRVTASTDTDGDLNLDGDADLSNPAALLSVYGPTCPQPVNLSHVVNAGRPLMAARVGAASHLRNYASYVTLRTWSLTDALLGVEAAGVLGRIGRLSPRVAGGRSVRWLT